MREPYTQLYIHLVWAVWDRLPLLTAGMVPRVYACIQAECRQLRCDPIAVGGVENHVHLLVRIPAALAISSLVKQVKGASSHLVTHELDPPDGFKWQGGYGAFTVSKADVPLIRDYILRQQEHHRDQTLDQELEFVLQGMGGPSVST